MTSGAPLAALVFLACACSGGDATDEKDTTVPDFPADYRDSFVEVRSCRPSGDHNLNTVRVLSTPSAAEAYRTHRGSFDVGDVLLKEEFEFGDSDCSGAAVGWTSMLRLPDEPAGVDGWRWQRVDAGRHVVEVDGSACMGCHASCGVAPDGHESTCGQQ